MTSPPSLAAPQRSAHLKKAALEQGNPLFHVFWGSSDADEKEMYPYDVGDIGNGARERWLWRGRFWAYFLARGVATAWWTAQPTPAF